MTSRFGFGELMQHTILNGRVGCGRIGCSSLSAAMQSAKGQGIGGGLQLLAAAHDLWLFFHFLPLHSPPLFSIASNKQQKSRGQDSTFQRISSFCVFGIPFPSSTPTRAFCCHLCMCSGSRIGPPALPPSFQEFMQQRFNHYSRNTSPNNRGAACAPFACPCRHAGRCS